MWPRTLKHTISLTLTGFVLASGVAISQLATHRYGTRLMEGAEARAENIAHRLALDAADKILTNDLVALEKLLSGQAASEPSLAYLFILRDDQVLSHTFPHGVPVQLLKANGTIDPSNGRIAKIVSEKGERFIDVAWPIFDGAAGTLRLGYAEAGIRREVAELWAQMSLLTVGVLGLALFLARLLIRRLTMPLETLTAAAEQIGAGTLDTRVEVGGRAEVFTLGEAFNKMLGRVREAVTRLEHSNRELDAKNHELDRAQRQLSASLTTVQEIAAIPDLAGISGYLLRRLGKLVECRQMTLLFGGNGGTAGFRFLGGHLQRFDRGALEEPLGRLDAGDGPFFYPTTAWGGTPPFPPEFAPERLALFPIRHLDQAIGALIVGCHDRCRCAEGDMGVVPLILRQAGGALRRAVQQEEQVCGLRERVEQNSGHSGIIGKDPRMQAVFRLIEEVAPTDASVLIQGESGTGKELVARAIHLGSERRDKPFIVIDCAAYPTTLLESELFGHEKGAFTGALRRKPGRFEQADGGTVFLDEIGEISPSAQIKLLRVLQSRQFERLGGEQTIKVSLRILTATNKPLLQEVKAGRFREDLFYRLNVIPIDLPPLRDRRNDIPLLARHFLDRSAADQRKKVDGIDSEAMRLLMRYEWPGNVRELENSVEHAVVLCKGGAIEATDLPDSILHAWRNPGASEPPSTFLDHEEQLLRQALDACGWNKTAAAQRLGISRSTLYEKMKRFNIARSPHTLH